MFLHVTLKSAAKLTFLSGLASFFVVTFLFFNALMATQTFVLMQHLSLHIDIQ